MIKTENVNYIYQPKTPYEKQALYDINLNIPDGSILAVIGHTGSGKSTLMQLFNALIRPTSGRIFIDGTEITSPKADLRLIRRKTGLVFQYPEHQLFEETVYKDIAFAPKNMGLDDKEIDARVRQSAAMTGLSEKYLTRSPFELSGGQKRRAAIAGVLAMNPKILILDEPTAGLDPRGKNEILNTIKALHEKNKDMIIIFVSHSMEDVAKTAKRVVVMNKGRIVKDGDTAEVFSHTEELRKIGLNVPQITILCEKLRKAGVPLKKDIYTVEQAVDILSSLAGGDCIV